MSDENETQVKVRTKRVGLPCYECQHRRDVPGNAHIQCVAPWKPIEVNSIMRAASEHGKRRGWFYFPYLYDPIWAGEWDERPAEPVECPRFAATPSNVASGDGREPDVPKANAPRGGAMDAMGAPSNGVAAERSEHIERGGANDGRDHS